MKQKKRNAEHTPIAVIAATGVFPGALNTHDLWENLLIGKDVITEIPKIRWDIDEFYDAYSLAPGKTNSRWGGFIELPAQFPCKDFNLKPRVACEMDPQQKILLIQTQHLLQSQTSLSHMNTGVFIGAGQPDFMLNFFGNPLLQKINPFSAMGMDESSLSSRIAYHFKLQGPALVVKTACSSSLTAIHLAIRALQLHDCNAAIAGGINVMLSPIIHICLTKGGFLSSQGRCKTFDASADGYVRSEGCGLILLKRYADALRDNDLIMGAIVGSAITHDGLSESFAAPNASAQMQCYQTALKNAQLSPEHITYIESHGTGTQLGDATEMHSIQTVYNENRSIDNPLYVGAIKSNIGHCESAAGIAGFIKTLRVLQHQRIPMNLHFHTLNPAISLKKNSITLPQQTITFQKPCDFAAISSFGFTGTNVHMILQRA